jgi:hypothetical protein
MSLIAESSTRSTKQLSITKQPGITSKQPADGRIIADGRVEAYLPRNRVIYVGLAPDGNDDVCLMVLAAAPTFDFDQLDGVRWATFEGYLAGHGIVVIDREPCLKPGWASLHPGIEPNRVRITGIAGALKDHRLTVVHQAGGRLVRNEFTPVKDGEWTSMAGEARPGDTVTFTACFSLQHGWELDVEELKVLPRSLPEVMRRGR